MGYIDFLAATTMGDQLLNDWRWLIGPRLEFLHATKAGDAFLRDPEDGSIHFLDTIEGNCERIAQSHDEFEAKVRIEENAERWLMQDLVQDVVLNGTSPGAEQCLSFEHPPILGGPIEPSNLHLCNIAMHFSIAGQLMEQVKDLPPGTKITDVVLGAPKTVPRNRRPWWRFW